MQTRVENGSIKCPRFGTITGIDCSCMRDTDCSGCFIFKSSIVESKSDSPILPVGEDLAKKLSSIFNQAPALN